MKTNAKRILSLILAFMLTFSLCGCGESLKSDEAEVTETTEEETEEVEKPVYTYDMSTLPDVSELTASDALTDPVHIFRWDLCRQRGRLGKASGGNQSDAPILYVWHLA